MTCPRCHGDRVIVGFCGRFISLPCPTCDGVGEITELHAARIEAGDRRRQERLSRRMTLREEAKRLGIGMVELSRLETGNLR